MSRETQCQPPLPMQFMHAPPQAPPPLPASMHLNLDMDREVLLNKNSWSFDYSDMTLRLLRQTHGHSWHSDSSDKHTATVGGKIQNGKVIRLF